jgi:hypothetical protein
MKMANEVDKVKGTAMAESFDYGEMAHEGFEGTTIKDLSIPFINVLQSNSPEVEDQTIPGAKAGDLVNSVTKEILKQPLIVLPLEKEESWVEWVPRNQGGGLVDRHAPDSELVLGLIKQNGGSRIPPKDAEGKRIAFKSPKRNDVIETHYVYALILSEDGETVEGYCVLSFASAKIKAFKDWMTALYTQKGRPPIFANRAKVSTSKQKNEQGTFYIYAIHPLKDTWRESLIPPNTENGMALLTEAKEFRKMIQEGLAKPAYDTAEDVRGGAGAEGDDPKPSNKKSSKADDDEIPF